MRGDRMHAGFVAFATCFLIYILWLAFESPRREYIIYTGVHAEITLRGREVKTGHSKTELAAQHAVERNQSYKDDFLVVLTSDKNHLSLVEASRAWRQGTRALVGVNFPPSDAQIEEAMRWNETLVFYPDDEYLRTYYPGDSRAALMPLYAKVLNFEYKWLLYGDDDTMFFLDTLAGLLEPFDHELPFLITDHLWWYNGSEGYGPEHPDIGAPRCAPCHWNSENDSLAYPPAAEPLYPPVGELERFPPLTGCPCTSRMLCETEARRRRNGEELLRQLALCSSEEAPLPGHFYSIHGGAGAILSKGLLDRLDPEGIETCVKSRGATGGDMLLTHCLWIAGHGITDPGASLQNPSRQLFDPGQLEVVHDLLAAVDWAGKCTADCEGRLQGMVSLHVRSRVLGIDGAARSMKQLATLYTQWQRGEKVDVLTSQRRRNRSQLR